MTGKRFAAVIAIAAATTVPAFAQEQFIELKDAPGKATVEQNCGGCHSLDYVRMNSPFLKADAWDAEVTKMVKVFGAPVSDVDMKTIRDYLVQNYGG